MKALFPHTLERLQYFIRLLIYFVSVSVIAAVLLPLANVIGIPAWLPLIVIIPLILLRFPCLDIPRFRSMGWSPWLVLLFFVPLINFIIQLLLLFVPPKQTAQADTSTSPLPGTRSPDWVRRNWKWFIPLLCLVALGSIVGFTLVFENLIKSSDAYSNALARTKSSPAVIAALGTPIKDGFFVNGSISENDDSGSAYFVIPITGPKGTAIVNVSATKSLGKWHFVDLVVQVNRTQEQINLLETNQLSVAMPTAVTPPAKTP
ncbi:MAG: cytochrome c oxidase assembly factor Coa1 family protein [Limisphaerales bacterium]